MEKKLIGSKFSYAMSLAASWAWGTSLIVGMELIQSRGIVPFIIWATANSMALPLFGFLAFRIPNLQKVIESKPVTVFTTIVSVFCLWIQMNAIFQQIMVLTQDKYSTVTKVGIVLGFIAMSFLLNKNGIVKSMIMDNPLWYFCYVVLLIILAVGIIQGNNTLPIVLCKKSDDINWAINSCFILFSGPFMCIQNWQFAKVLKPKKMLSSHYIAGILFAIYMAFVGILGSIEFNGAMLVLMILVVLAVALSTGDAAIVGMQEIAGEKVGLALSIVSSLFWPFVIPLGVMGLWTTMGNTRKFVVLICIIIAIGLYFRDRKKEVASEHE